MDSTTPDQFSEVRRRPGRRTTVPVFGVLCTLMVCSVGACSTDGRSDGGFGSPEQAARAFAPDDLPAVEPWDDSDGACRVLLVGDSLVEASVASQEDAFSYLGCESIVDGLAARSLSEGWQCLGDGGTSMAIVLRSQPEPGNPTCRPSGLELLELWADFTTAASATVIALGTNDAGMFTSDTWERRWQRVVDITQGPLVFVTVGAQPRGRWVDKATRYNETLRQWCPREPRCVLAEWDLTEPARDPSSYIDHVHLTRSAGEMRAVFIATITRRVAVPAPLGPQRWRAPALALPPGPVSTDPGTTGPGANGPSTTQLFATDPGTSSVPVSTTTVPTSTDPAPTTTTTTTVVEPAESPSP